MREFERKRIIKKRIYSKFTVVALVILLGFLVSGTFNVYKKSRQSEIQLNIAAVRLAELEKSRDNLEIKVEEIKSDIGIEEQIRNKFYLAKEDEHAVFIIDEDPEPEPEKPPRGLKSFWHKTTDFFGF